MLDNAMSMLCCQYLLMSLCQLKLKLKLYIHFYCVAKWKCNNKNRDRDYYGTTRQKDYLFEKACNARSKRRKMLALGAKYSTNRGL